MSDQPTNDPPITYHLVPREVWVASSGSDQFLPEGYAADGFIHCTDGHDEVIAVGNRYYRADPRPYVVLAIARSRLTSPVKYEDPGRIFPHIYGPLNTGAVEKVFDVQRDADGTFVGVDAK
jgi:uncharacterized protein (DUF952 family)